MTPARGVGRLLGVDPGDARVGFAVCDPDRIIASPLDTYARLTPERDAAYVQKLVVEERVVGIVVGLAVHLNGREGTRATEARIYGDWLIEVTGLPVVYWDERFTSRQAESALWKAGLTHKQRKARRDRVAAQILLQDYIDSGCPPGVEIKGLDGGNGPDRP